MRKLIGHVCIVAALTGLSWFGLATAVAAQDGGGSAGQLERLEQRVNELAERQEQFMRRFGPQLEHQERMTPPAPENIRPPMPPAGAQMTGPQCPLPAKCAKCLHRVLGLVLLAGLLCNILLAIWIFTDIRKRDDGSGIFVALALVAGIPAALIYALTRIAENKG